MRAAGVRVPETLATRFPPSPPGERGEGGEGKGGKGGYKGGLVDIVGTGGDGHNTFNVSTTSAILATALGINICKHGNKASTSSSGSADILAALGADLGGVTPSKVAAMFQETTTTPPPPRTTGETETEAQPGTFCFLYAPTFHPSMRHISPVRTALPFKTIFNLLGPLVNPIDYSLSSGLEARIIGVSNPALGRIFADTLVLLGVDRALVVCGDEALDEISPATTTHVWKVRTLTGETGVEEFHIHPTKTFGIPTHPLTQVAGGKGPQENAGILERLVKGQIDPEGDGEERAILDFVVLNTAALAVVAGVVGGGEWGAKEEVDGEGVAVGGKWREAVERVREGVSSGRAWGAWRGFVEWSRKAEGGGVEGE